MNIIKIYILGITTLVFSIHGNSQTLNSDSLIPYRVGSQWGYSDNKGTIVIEPTYESASFFFKNKAIVKKGNECFLITPENKKSSKQYQKMKLRTNCDYICYYARINDKLEIIDTNGAIFNKEWGPGCYEAIDGGRTDDELIKHFSQYGVYSQYFRNDTLKVLYKLILPTNVDNKYFYVFTQSGVGLMYNDGKIIKTILDTSYQKITMYNSKIYGNVFSAKKNELEALFSETDIIIPFKYKSITLNEVNNAMLQVETVNGKIGYINFYGFEYFKD